MRTKACFLALSIALAGLSPSRAAADRPLTEDLEEVTERIALSPGEVSLLLERSELFLQEARPEDALVDLRLAGAIAPGDPRIAAQRAAVLFVMGRDDEALAEIEACLALRAAGPTFTDLALRARILARLGRTADAIDEYGAALALRDDVELYLERGRLLERAGRLDEAAQHYGDGLRALGGAVVLRLAAIELDLRRGPAHAERALVRIDEVLAAAPARARWLLLRGRALDVLGRAAEARAARVEALAEIDRRLVRRPSAALRVLRGEALLALGRPRDALAEPQRARDLAPRPPRAAELELRAQRAIGGAR